MQKIPAMVDMAMDDDEKAEAMSPSLGTPKYPFGLSISLCEKELEKIGVDENDLEIGDMLHLHALAKVTSVSSQDLESGSHCRVELQICYMSGEDEEEENEENEEAEDNIVGAEYPKDGAKKLNTRNNPGRPDRMSRLYKIGAK